MTRCSACDAENRPEAQFCDTCGARLGDASPAREVRKTVSVLFCDVTGSTALGESTDPEALRALLARYFERMRAIVERHGGAVEKFIGDAVMAVFGVPVVHEDDALRACRAAVEMRGALPELGVQARIGVNTGAVVTGTAERLATGDAVNVAARLEQAAGPGEILIGPETYRLVRTAVDAEAVEPLTLKGKSTPLPAYRLLAVTGEPQRRFATPFVGRERELRALGDAFARATSDRSCQLFTMLGMPGVGKSRVAEEFVSSLTAAQVVRGRCLSYGEGITYWPVVEVVKQLGARPSDPVADAALRSLLRETDAPTSAEEIAWAFRRLLEEQAQERPLVVVFDDIHWGEQTFLDLIEHIADLSRDAPLLLFCVARPELLERRPGWGGGKWNAATVLLEPLDGAETDRLIDDLGGVQAELRERIREAADGNPLFVEEMLALVRDSANGAVEVPPSIHALLAARLDQLDPADRAVLERGSVEGRTFHRGAVLALTDGDGQLPARLVSLVRKEYVRPERTRHAGDEAYRFRHLLIRDAAYDALSKATRAELHERFADWLEEHGGDLTERDEILGHHLEQAALYKAELGQPDLGLAERAGERLAAAGRRALWRGDLRAASALLERALELLRPIRFDVHLELDFVRTFTDARRAAAEANVAVERARASGDEVALALARTRAAQFASVVGDGVDPDELEGLAQAALPLLEGREDDAGLVYVWQALMFVASLRVRCADVAVAAQRSLEHSRRAGQQMATLFGLDYALRLGAAPADEALRMLDTVLPDPAHPLQLLSRAQLLGMLGRFDEAWAIIEEQGERFWELTGTWRGELDMAVVASLAGDHERAAECYAAHIALLERLHAQVNLSTYLPVLGRELCMLGRYDEAEGCARRGRELGDEGDIITQMLWRQVQALVCAHRGEHEAAERLAREAVALAEPTDALNFQGDAFGDLAEVLLAAGSIDDATAALWTALDRFERKRNLPMAARVRERLAVLGASIA